MSRSWIHELLHSVTKMKKTIVLATSLLIMLLLCPAWLRSQNIAASNASSHVGETATVCGMVTGVHYAAKGKPTFINFDKPYPSQDFTVMIWDEDRTGFGDLQKDAGRKVCAHGPITMYRGKPEMVLRDPAALEAK
jgi:hypothetical protein